MSSSVRSLRALVGFPDVVNEVAARVVAAGVALLALTTLLTGALWLVVLLALGFAARTLSGPRFSLLGRLATTVVAPRLGPPRHVPGPPKRFAQGIGLAITTSAGVAGLVLGWTGIAYGLLAVLLTFATLEALLGLCAGCWLFGLLMRARIVPADTCAECQDIWARYGESARS